MSDINDLDACRAVERYEKLHWRTWWSPRLAYFFSINLTCIFFIADVILPAGAIVAIGYCVVPALAAGTRSRRAPIVMTILCIILNWVASFLEPAGDPGWEPIFNRAMLTIVLGVTLFLVLRRMTAMEALTTQTQLLQQTAYQLEQSNSELASFSSVVAHDLRAPLNTVGLLVQFLPVYQMRNADSELNTCVGSIDTEIRHMNEFIQHLLQYGRVESSHLTVQDCDFGAILNQVQQNLNADIKKDGVQISNDPLPVIKADSVLISQLFQNLIENSIKYRGEEAPHIHISASEQPDGWLFSVRDNGIGIRPEDSERVFKTFVQADQRSIGKGVGLGLATCKRIVERHGGHIHVESTPGNGANFLFTIPGNPAVTKPTAARALLRSQNA